MHPGLPLVALAAASLAAGVAPAAQAVGLAEPGPLSGPEQVRVTDAHIFADLHPGAVPTGVNDFSCTPSARHPRPVILVEGTFGTIYTSWAYIGPELKKQGYCVFAPELPKDQSTWWKNVPASNATAPIMQSARYTGEFVDRVLEATHAEKVDMIGWSQGALVIRGYAKFFGGADAKNPSRNKIGGIVTMGGTNHGTTLSGIGGLAQMLGHDAVAGLASAAAADQLVGSDYLGKLNADGDTMPGLTYTVIGTDRDGVSTPWDATFLTAGVGAKVTNVHLQAGCGLIGTDHSSLPFNQRVLTITENALDPSMKAPLVCSPSFPGIN